MLSKDKLIGTQKVRMSSWHTQDQLEPSLQDSHQVRMTLSST